MRTPRSAAAVLGGLALAFAVAQPAQAQTFPTLGVGQSLQGTLSERDPAMYERGRFKVYQFRAQPGVRYVATMQSDTFDSYLTLARTVGGVTDHMMFDDDGGSQPLASRLRFEVPAAGTYMLIAQSLGEDGLGSFTIALDTSTIRPAVVQELRVGATVQGELTEEDAEHDEYGGFYDLYRFSGTAGQRLRLELEAADGMGFPVVGTMVDGTFVPLESVGGGSEGTLVFALPETGDYYVQAGSYGEGIGAYTLRLQERAPAPAPRVTPIRRGETIEGAIEEGDAELDDGRWYDAYAYTGRAGEQLRIEMDGEEFDAYLIIGRMVDGRFEELDRNDDDPDGQGTDSAIEIELPEDGRYIIQATTFLDSMTGPYELTVGSEEQ